MLVKAWESLTGRSCRSPQEQWGLCGVLNGERCWGSPAPLFFHGVNSGPRGVPELKDGVTHILLACFHKNLNSPHVDQQHVFLMVNHQQDQALSPWSGSTDFKALDNQRTSPREYQIVRTWNPLEYKTQHHPTTSSTLCRMSHLNNKQNKNMNPINSRQDYHLTQPFPSEEKQTKTQHKSQPIQSLYKPLDQP